MKPLTKSANDFCRYSFILGFDIVIVIVVFVVILLSCQLHQEISKQLKCFANLPQKIFKMLATNDSIPFVKAAASQLLAATGLNFLGSSVIFKLLRVHQRDFSGSSVIFQLF